MSVLTNKPLLIAGPCSAENEAQLLETALTLKETGIELVRAGIWKPRTRPGTFEGIGDAGLTWIINVKEATQLRFAIEVANPHHVDKALKAGIDVLWIGARSTVNPFTVQAIADALRGVDIPVMVKNPVNPELSLWMGALERLDRAGLKQLAAIHRGFCTSQVSKFRNLPLWGIAIELKSKLPDVPIICDPSHMAGQRDLILEIAQKALDLDYNGLMVEVHPDPASALSDSAQQLTPAAFTRMLQSLCFKKPKCSDAYYVHEMEDIREEIDHLDREIVDLMETRMRLVKKAGLKKIKHNVTILQLQRWQNILDSRSSWISNGHVRPEFIQDLFKIIHEESLRIQLDITENHLSDLT